MAFFHVNLLSTWIMIVVYQLPVVPSSLVYSWQTDTSSTTSAPVLDKRLDAQPIHTVGTATEVMTQCLMKCYNEPKCKSINFLLGKACELLAVTEEENGYLFVDAKGYIHVSSVNMKLEPIYQKADNCNGHGVPYSANEPKLNQKKCVCDYGWQGDHCQNKVIATWLAWQEWSPCSVTCGIGWRKREHICDQKENTASIGQCTGASFEYEECTSSCPEWTYWGEWGGCVISNQCGVGNKYRQRICQGNDEHCPGFSQESTPCDVLSCDAPSKNMIGEGDLFGAGLLHIHNGSSWLPVCSNGFTDYAGELACKEMGFAGFHKVLTAQRSTTDKFWAIHFNCSHGTELLLTECQHNIHEVQSVGSDCDTQVHLYCVVDGYFEDWSAWGECSVSCGGGNQTRTRDCVGVAYGGKTCQGHYNETQECGQDPCAVNCVWSAWSEWGMCNVTCGGGIKQRYRNSSSAVHGGNVCNGDSHSTEICSTNACPIDCAWEAWSEWGACNVTCGGGIKQRYRNSSGPLHGGKFCDGDYLSLENCSTNPCPIDCLWNAWSEWGACNVTCGGGIKHRYRNSSGPLHGGKSCDGDSFSLENCSTNPCPIDCAWNAWSEWDACNITCGGGIKQRYRNSSGPLHGGKSCDGDSFSLENCSTNPCPIDCAWNAWSEWDACNVTCGGGIKQRHRNSTGPLHGGKSCDGDYLSFENCSTNPCPIDGVWGVWSNWSDCSTTCGLGLTSRNRTCTGPFYDGRQCEGWETQQENCTLMECAVQGQWTEWTTWALCSVTCGTGGSRSRTRSCEASENPGGLEVVCDGEENSQTETCHEYNCTPLAKTCEEWKTRGLNDSVAVQVQPEYESFWVRCNLAGKDGFVITEITHTNMNRTRVDGFESQGGFILKLEYTTSINNINAFIDKSQACQQYISWECHAAAIKNPLSATGANTYWSDRFQDPKYYWGGADHNGDNCACGDTNTCAQPDTKCNCDANDDQLRQDAGYLTYKQDLPITEFLAGDTGDKTQYYNIGSVQCWGEDEDYANNY